MTANDVERPRLLLLTQWFDPEATFKGLVFARALVRRGYDVEVVTGFPNYPGGKLFPGYSIRWLQREQMGDVAVARVALYPSHDNSPVRRAMNYLSFAFSSLMYGLLAAKTPTVIYAYHPPLTVAIAAAIIGKLRGAPVVCDIQDLWPDSLRATGMLSNPRALALIGRVCDWVYRHSTRVVVLSPGFKRLLMDRGVPESKLEVIYNWSDEGSLKQGSDGVHPAFAEPDRFRVVFAGNIGKAQGLETVLEAARMLQRRAPAIEFCIVGGGIELENIKGLAAGMELSNVRFVPRVPVSEVGGLLRRADVLLVHLLKDPLFEITIPSKTQAYMAIGRPILMAVAGDAAALVTAARCGLTAEPGNAAAVASATLALFETDPGELRRMGDRGRDYYAREMSLEVGVDRFARVFEDVSRR